MAILIRALACATGLMLACTTVVSANVIYYENATCFASNPATGGCGNRGFIDQTFGDVAGSLDVIYGNETGDTQLGFMQFWGPGFGSKPAVTYSGSAINQSYTITLDLLAGASSITLNSIENGAFSLRELTYRVIDTADDSVLASFSATPTTEDVTVTNPGSFTSTSGLRIETGVASGNWGIASIDYTLTPAAVVPLPAAAWMVLSGLVGLAGLRRFQRG